MLSSDHIGNTLSSVVEHAVPVDVLMVLAAQHSSSTSWPTPTRLASINRSNASLWQYLPWKITCYLAVMPWYTRSCMGRLFLENICWCWCTLLNGIKPITVWNLINLINIQPVLKAIQGHPEAGRLWKEHINKILFPRELKKFTTTTRNDHCIYRTIFNGEEVFLLIRDSNRII